MELSYMLILQIQGTADLNPISRLSRMTPLYYT
jgi:hypothetical protein